jgi:methionyl aminopeptidase
VSVQTVEELLGLKRAGRVVTATLRAVRDAVAPGVSTAALDRVAAAVFSAHGARSGPVLTYGYPGAICISVEDQVVHGIPGARILRAGEIVTLDVAAELDGYHADAAITVPVGMVDDERRRLLSATRAALSAGVRAVEPGARLRDVGAAVESSARRNGFHVFRELTGHGIGTRMHEEPTVFNWPAPSAGQVLTDGLVFTIEPMLTAGRTELRLDRDGWTMRTGDGRPTAHEEHTVMVSTRGPVILTGSR